MARAGRANVSGDWKQMACTHSFELSIFRISQKITTQKPLEGTKIFYAYPHETICRSPSTSTVLHSARPPQHSTVSSIHLIYRITLRVTVGREFEENKEAVRSCSLTLFFVPKIVCRDQCKAGGRQ